MRRVVSDGRRQSEGYERRRQRLIADACLGEVLDLGHAQLPNPYLAGERVVGLDLVAPTVPSGYREDRIGSVMELEATFGARRFDTVVAAELIEHLEDPYGFLRSVRRVIGPDGRLVLTTPNPLGFPVLFLEILRSRRWFYTTDHTFYFLPRWVDRMLDFTGFELERVHPVGLWLPVGHLPWAPTWMSYQLLYVARPRS